MNAIVICLDTLRWDYLGCYGANRSIRTPLIDSYAERATRFDAAYCGSFPTIPMRVDAWTGDVNWPRYGWRSPEPTQPVLPSLLRQGGVHTALIMDTKNMDRQGFGDYFDDYTLIEKPPTNNARAEDTVFPVPRENIRQNGRGFARDRANWAHYKHEADWFVARTMTAAAEWLEDNSRQDPFFLWVDTFEIHEDWFAPDFYTEMYSPDYHGLDYSYPNYGYTDIYQPHELERLRARYAGEVTLTDRWVGRLLRTIEYLGLFDNTVVILTSDHGMYLGEHNRAGKHTVNKDDPWPLFDEVARVPLLVWSPWPQPTRTAALVQPADIMPTVLEILDVPAESPYGKSWLPIISGETDRRWDHIFTSCHSWQGPGRIEFLDSLITVTTDEWTLSTGPAPHKPELYHRPNDPAQQCDLAADRPEVTEDLSRALADFMRARGADPALYYNQTYPHPAHSPPREGVFVGAGCG